MRTLSIPTILSGLTLVVGVTAMASEMPPARSQQQTYRRQVQQDDQQQPPPQQGQGCNPQYSQCGGPGPGFDPRNSYYCNGPCGAPPVPVVVYQVLPPPPPPPISVLPMPYVPVYPLVDGAWGPGIGSDGIPGNGYRPVPVPHGGYGYRGGGYRGPVPTPYGRRMAYHAGCSIEANRPNGDIAVVSKDGEDLFVNNSADAAQFAEIMKAYYEQAGFSFCTSTETEQAPVREIEI